MKLSTLTLLLACMASTPASCTPNPKEFRLRTQGAANPAHNDLWLYAYHTGAGFNDAVLSKNGSSAPKAYLNGSETLFDLGTEYPWGMIIGSDTNYASWESVQINVGGGTAGFQLNGTGLVWSYEEGFGGWLVCEWYHNAPQLFWLNRWYEAVVPSSCSRVELKPVYSTTSLH